jgi:hypothetical protein
MAKHPYQKEEQKRYRSSVLQNFEDSCVEQVALFKQMVERLAYSNM